MISGRFTGLRREDLDLGATLRSGQVFRWTSTADGAWVGVLGARRVRLQQAHDASVYWEGDGPDSGVAIRSFLRLDDLDLPATAEAWCSADPCFAEAWSRQPGVRVLRQEPEECFFSFLCASVAPISRISSMLRGVAGAYGEPLAAVEQVPLHAFPSAARLATVDPEALRRLGLGFRGPRVARAAARLAASDAPMLLPLRAADCDRCRAALMQFEGVGAKIAECVGLFSLDQDSAIPVDTHIWKVACSRYLPALAGKSLTPRVYAEVGDTFRDRFGPFAGWAQQTLFYGAAVAPAAVSGSTMKQPPRKPAVSPRARNRVQ